MERVHSRVGSDLRRCEPLSGAPSVEPQVRAGYRPVPREWTPWNPDWVTHKAGELAAAAGVKLNIKGLRHYTASQLLAARFDLRNTAARLGHGSGGATTLRHYV